MRTAITYHIWPRSTSWASVLDLANRLATQRGFTAYDHTALLQEDVAKEHYIRSLDETIEFLKRLHSFTYLDTTTYFVGADNDEKLSIGFSIHGATVKITVDSINIDMIQGIHEHFRQEFHFTNPPAPQSARPLFLQPTVFVGRHFDPEADEAFGRLKYFLELLGFDVKQGLEYSSQDIPEKVKERISQQDIFIGLVTGDRDHAWLHAEPAYALGKDKHVILIVEESANDDPTIVGKDLEQIRVPGNAIEKAFSPLLRELRDIRVKGL